MILIGTGTELDLCVNRQQLTAEGKRCRVSALRGAVRRQADEYKEECSKCVRKRMVVEAAESFKLAPFIGWMETAS